MDIKLELDTDLYNRVVHMAYQHVKYTKDRSVEPADIAHQVMLSVMSGKRKLEASSRKEMLSYLYTIMRSEFSNFYSKEENRRRAALPEDCEPSTDESEYSWLSEPPLLLTVAAQYDDVLQRVGENDQILKDLLVLLNAGATEHEEIGRALGVSPNMVNNLKKRLRRVLASFAEESDDPISLGGDGEPND